MTAHTADSSRGPVRLGFLTPSSNTVLEPVIGRMLAGLPDVTAHFSRFRVTEISLRPSALAQFDNGPILDAAALLKDARCDAIAWCGTSSGWLGFSHDRRLCSEIVEATGAHATTSMLALNEILDILQVSRLGLVTPYVSAVQEKIVENYRAIGISCIAEQHLSRSVNFSFAEVDPGTIEKMVRSTAAAGPQAIAVICTNLRGADLVDTLEAETGIPVLDSVAVTVWKSLKQCGINTAALRGWGRLFACDGLLPAWRNAGQAGRREKRRS